MRLTRLAVTTSVLSLVAIPAHAASDRQGVPQDINAIGSGWDSSLGMQMSRKCVKLKKGVSSPKLPEKLVKSDGERSLDVTSSSLELIKSLSSSVSASYSGVGSSASGSLSSIDKSSYSKFQSYAVLRDDINFQPIEVQPDDLEFTADAKKMLRKSDWPARFRAICGDTFLTGMIPGGRLRVVLKVSASTQKMQSSNSIDLQAASGSYSGNAAREEALKVKMSDKSISIDYKASPVQDKLPTSTTFSDYFDVWSRYESDIQQRSPHFVEVKTQSYLPLILEQLNGSNDMVIPDWVDRVVSGFSLISRLVVDKSGAEYVLSHDDQFAPQNSAELNQLISKLDDDINKVQRWGINCISSSGKKCSNVVEVSPYGAIPNRAGDWLSINVLGRGKDAYQPSLIGSTFENAGVGQIKGKFIIDNGGRKNPIAHSQRNYISVTDRQSGKETGRFVQAENQPLPSSFSVPPNSDVYFYVFDDYWDDNHIDPEDPALGRVGEVYTVPPSI